MTSLQHQHVIARIDRLSHDGRGIATIDQKITFVRGALVGELVALQVVKKHRNYLEADVVTVLESSAERTEAQCPHFLICGGCSCQHMLHSTQVREKLRAVLEQFKHTADITPQQILPPLVGSPWGYRNKARLGVRFVEKKNKLLIGFREHQGRYLADLTACKTLHPIIGERLTELAELLLSLQSFRDIPQLEIAVGDDAAAIIMRHLCPLSAADINILTEYAINTALHIYLQSGDVHSIKRLYPTAGTERLHYHLPNFSLTMAFHPSDFTQINPYINRHMVTTAIDLLDPKEDENILDLFCGIGNFTLPLARRAQSVMGIEGDERMVSRAQENALNNHITNVSFYAADLTDANAIHFDARYFAKIIIDPPRSGAQAIIPVIAQHQPQRIVYISCNPATLVRDAGLLVHTYGYQLSHFLLIDMFPHTAHVESMAVFERCAAK